VASPTFVQTGGRPRHCHTSGAGHLHSHAGVCGHRQLRGNGDRQRHAAPRRLCDYCGHSHAVVESGPCPHRPAITTLQNTPGTSQVSANDPDTGQTQTFSVSTTPAHGTAAVSASGLATYTPTTGLRALTASW